MCPHQVGMLWNSLKAQIAEKSPDIMMFTEVIPKAQKNPVSETQVEIEGYQLFHNFNFTDENLGASGIRGVAIYVKENIPCEEVKLQSSLCDHVWVKISLVNYDKLLCGCVYRSPLNDKDVTKDSTSKVCSVIKEAVASLFTSPSLFHFFLQFFRFPPAYSSPGMSIQTPSAHSSY